MEKERILEFIAQRDLTQEQILTIYEILRDLYYYKFKESDVEVEPYLYDDELKAMLDFIGVNYKYFDDEEILTVYRD